MSESAAGQGQRLEQIYSPKQGLCLVFQSWVLQISLAAGQPQIGLLRARPTPPDSDTRGRLSPSPFAMLLRKHLKGARLKTIHTLAADRILCLAFLRGDDSCELVLELTGRHSNFFLLNPEKNLLGAWRKDGSQLRQLQNGSPYQAPPAPPDYSQNLTPIEAQIAELPADGHRSDLIWRIWEADLLHSRLKTQMQQMDQRLKQGQKALARKLLYWETALKRAEAAPQLQRAGELLQGAWNHLPAPGASSIWVIDYFHPEQIEVEIPLDPALGFQANLARYFRQAQRLEKTQVQAESQLLQLWQTQTSLEAWAIEWSQIRAKCLEALALGEFESVKNGLNQAELAASAAGLAPLQSSEQNPRRMREKAARPWREYHTPQGAIIRVGKGAESNEKLLKLARGQDIWLHTRNWPGSYVWIPLQKNEQPSPETLRAAALLALHFSQLPNENKAEIMYTPFKFLQKQRKAKTGEVSVRQFKSLIVSHDQASLAGLLTSKSE
ncbi:MAG: DUF814 domain-containing protein [Candidatus Sericytochromatia bacterium]|nr:DUF814 domain-containing protein [Candidatus Sericytochromatia bacterium]